MENKIEKPPVGVMPEYIWQEKRLQAIDEAIGKRLETLHEIPMSWIDERNRLVTVVKNNRKG